MTDETLLSPEAICVRCGGIILLKDQSMKSSGFTESDGWDYLCEGCTDKYNKIEELYVNGGLADLDVGADDPLA